MLKLRELMSTKNRNIIKTKQNKKKKKKKQKKQKQKKKKNEKKQKQTNTALYIEKAFKIRYGQTNV